MSAERRLISTRRRVETRTVEEYHRAWRTVAGTVKAGGANAWRFRSAGDSSLYLEFFEFPRGNDPRLRDDVGAALLELESVARGEAEEWIDASREGGEP